MAIQAYQGEWNEDEVEERGYGELPGRQLNAMPLARYPVVAPAPINMRSPATAGTFPGRHGRGIRTSRPRLSVRVCVSSLFRRGQISCTSRTRSAMADDGGPNLGTWRDCASGRRPQPSLASEPNGRRRVMDELRLLGRATLTRVVVPFSLRAAHGRRAAGREQARQILRLQNRMRRTVCPTPVPWRGD